jgi:hypothetical protein
MFRAKLICSDEDCTEEFEAYGSLEELEALACDCGCSLELIAVSEAGEASVTDGFVLVPVE